MSERQGVVTDFDEPKGWGTVRDDDGVEHWFHCTAIADGTRRIDVGAAVRFIDRPGRQGRWEATEIAPA